MKITNEPSETDMRGALDRMFLEHCSGCRQMSCDNTYNEILKCQGRFRNGRA